MQEEETIVSTKNNLKGQKYMIYFHYKNFKRKTYEYTIFFFRNNAVSTLKKKLCKKNDFISITNLVSHLNFLSETNYRTWKQ